jgi:hypothetical protein
VTEETGKIKDNGKHINIRHRADGVVVFYSDGSPRVGLREGPVTEAMYEAIEAAHAEAVALEVSI